MMSVIGKEQPRVDGPLKVSGKAMYTSDHHFPGMVYAVPVCSTIANGEIQTIDTSVAENMPGVRAIFQRRNIGKLFRAEVNHEFGADMSRLDERRPPLEDDVVRYSGQYVALAVADTFAQAMAAADAVKVTYREHKPNVDERLVPETSQKVESERGDAGKAFTEAGIQVDQTYDLPPETHNPIELHASVALWDGSTFTLYETSQGVVNHRNVLAQMLGVPKENVRVITKFLGSGFGGKLWPWTQSALAAAAARQLGRPVKLVVSRRMMFQSVGHRPRIQQRIRLSATRDGKLTSLRQDWVNHTSILDDYKENCGEATAHMYSVPNLRITSALARRNVGTPTPMRGPGAVPGLWATESAMDELALKLGMDPVELRLANEPRIDEGLKIPFSSRHLKECLSTGAERFGWSRRNPRVGSMKRDGLTLGWGMAGCSWQAFRFACAANVELRADGTARVSCATQDIGTGTYTILAQLAAEKLGLPLGWACRSTGSRLCSATRNCLRARSPVDRRRPRPWCLPSWRRRERRSIPCSHWLPMRTSNTPRGACTPGASPLPAALHSRTSCGCARFGRCPVWAAPRAAARSELRSRRSRATRSARTSWRSPGNRRSRGCA